MGSEHNLKSGPSGLDNGVHFNLAGPWSGNYRVTSKSCTSRWLATFVIDNAHAEAIRKLTVSLW
jgi:hypothetical protein